MVFQSIRRHTGGTLVTGVRTWAFPSCRRRRHRPLGGPSHGARSRHRRARTRRTTALSHSQGVIMPNIETRLASLGIELPQVCPPVANYVSSTRSGSIVQISGQLSTHASRSEEHTSELPPLIRISYAAF